MQQVRAHSQDVSYVIMILTVERLPRKYNMLLWCTSAPDDSHDSCVNDDDMFAYHAF